MAAEGALVEYDAETVAAKSGLASLNGETTLGPVSRSIWALDCLS